MAVSLTGHPRPANSRSRHPQSNQTQSPGPSLVCGTRRNNGQPRMITDTSRAAHGLYCQLERWASCPLQRRGQLASEALVGTAKLAGLGSSLHAVPTPAPPPGRSDRSCARVRRSDTRCRSCLSLESLDGFGEQRDLIELRGTRNHDQLVTAALLEGRNIAPDHLLTHCCAGSDLVGELAKPTVVVLHVRVGLLPRPRPEREVGKRELARLTRAPGRLPRLINRPRQLGEHLRRAATHDPAIAEAGGAPQGRLIMAADDQLRAALARRRRPNRTRVAALLTA